MHIVLYTLNPLLLFGSYIVSNSLQLHGLQHDRFPWHPLSARICSKSCPLSQWCYLIISSSVTPFSLCLQSFPSSRSFPISQLLISVGQSIGSWASVHPINIEGWFLLGLTDLISLHSKGLSRFFNTTVRKHQFFSAQPSLCSKTHICLWLLEKL